MKLSISHLAVVSLLLPFCILGSAQAVLAIPLVKPVTWGTLLDFDFNGANPWPHATTSVLSDRPVDITQTIENGAVGTIDSSGATEPSNGCALTAKVGDATSPWSAVFASGLLPVDNQENDLGKLTLAFSLSASAARPVTVRAESFSSPKVRTGGLETTIYPAAPDFYQRYALELSNFKPFGAGKFQPDAANVQFSFVIEGPSWPDKTVHQLRIDNLQYARPAFYVSPQGDDHNDGRTEKTALADPQKAVDLAQAGDIILLMNGTYSRALTSSPDDGVVAFRRAGTPAAWITLKNYPGHTPVLTTTDSWNILKIGRGTKTQPSTEPALAYLEVRGLHLRGEGNVAQTKYADLIGKPNPQTNANGLRVEGRYETNTMHHIRVADNFVEFVPCHGIFTYDTDWLTVENNIVRDNSWSSIWEGSGISMLGGRDFDGTRNVYKTLARGNQASGNRCFVKSAYTGQIRNGNGIILDANNEKPEKSYGGRTLVQNNLSFNNGGVGIQMWGCHRIDLINNTVYFNGASPEQNWGQMAVTICDDVRMINNIVVGQPDRPLDTWYGATENRATNIVRAHNLYFGGRYVPIKGETDLIADPLFVHAATDPDTADFHLKPGSAALSAGQWEPFSPLTDVSGKLRPLVGNPDLGAFQH